MKEDIKEKKVLGYVIAIVIFITVLIILLVHFNNTSLVDPDELTLKNEIVTYNDESGIYLKYKNKLTMDGNSFKIDDIKVSKKLKKKNVYKIYTIGLYDEDSNLVSFDDVSVNIPIDSKYKVISINKIEGDNIKDGIGFSLEDGILSFVINSSANYGIIIEK